MTTQFLPLLKPQFLDNDGAVLAGGKVESFLAGTSTQTNTFSDRAGATPNTNPVVLDSAGRANIYLDKDVRYKFVVMEADDVVLYTVDNVYTDAGDIEYDPLVTYAAGSVGDAISDIEDVIEGGAWLPGPTPTYVSATSFTVVGNYTSTFQAGRRLKFAQSGDIFGSVNSASFGGGLTTVVVAMDSTALSGSLTAVEYSMLESTGTAVPAYVGSGTDLTARPINDKMGDIPSLLDFDGATPDEQFASALANGVKWLFVPTGVYSTAGWAIANTDTLEGITFAQGAQLLLTTATDAIALDIQKHVFTIRGKADVKSTGSKTDGNNTTGIRIGTITQGISYFRVEQVRFENFSNVGILVYQPVYHQYGRIDGYSCGYGVSVLPDTLGNIGTTLEFGPSYISGCLRGFNLKSCAWVTIREPVMEFCGSSTTTDGALHFDGAANITVIDQYGEQNGRNMVKHDSKVTFIEGGMFTATAADICTYTGVAFDERGSTKISSVAVNARRLDYDVIDDEDLTIGLNLTVPKTGESVIFGHETMLENSGTLTNATWTSVYNIPNDELFGTNTQKAMYEYVCYAGSADLSTGFDSGTIFNGTLRSYSGSTPAWLRLNVAQVEMNVTSTTYGLNFKIVLRRIYPGA